MYEYKKVKGQLTSILEEMYSTGRRLAHYDKELGISIWDRAIKKVQTKQPKKAQKIINTYFNELVVKGNCSYYKDIEELYFDWVRVRAECGKFKEFSDVSEKSAFKKLGKFPKPIAERMLEDAGSSCYGKLYDLAEGEVSKIMEPLRQIKQKEENKMQGFSNDNEKKIAEQRKQKIESYIIEHPELEKEAREYVLERHSTLRPDLQNKMIHAKTRQLANNIT